MIQHLGPYRIERVLGRGGMGTVYAGVNRDTNQRAAIKVLAPPLATDESFRVRFTSEIETLKTLKHPHIVQLYGYGEQDSHLFYAMELVEAINLQEELSAGRRFHWREVSRMGIQVCGALKHAHDHGVIHRDLKPANLLLDAHNNVKLTDFGIAKLFGHTQLTGAGGVLGTADYMAPEQAEGLPVSVRSDLYSLGSVLYALLAGRPPFCGKSIPEVVHMVRFDNPLPVRRFSAETPAELERIVDELLQKDPQKRIPTALALSNRLQSMEHALSVHPHLTDSGAQGIRVEHDSAQLVDNGITQSGTIAEAKNEFDPGLADRETISAPPDFGQQVVNSADLPTPMRPATDEAAGPLHDPPQEAPSSASHFTTIDEDASRTAAGTSDVIVSTGSSWWRTMLPVLLLLVIVAAVWYSRRPLTADQLYERIAAAAHASLEDPPRLVAAEADIQQFLERFAEDRRATTVAEYQEEIELDRLHRQLLRRARRSDNTDNLSPIEQLYVQALEAQPISREAAAVKMAALIDVFENQPDASEKTRRCVRLAKRKLKQWRTAIEQTGSSHLEILKERMEYAERVHATDPASAQVIWRGIIQLYADKPWAEGVVQQARKALAASDHPPAETSKHDN